MKKIAIGFCGLVALLVLFKWGGQLIGGSLGVESVRQEAKAQRVPAGFFDVKWLASMDDVRALRPNVMPETAETLVEQETLYGRPVKVTYFFKDNAVMLFIITFSTPANRESFQVVQTELNQDYGPMAGLSQDSDQYGARQCSKKRTERFEIDHCVRELSSFVQEQILVYRTARLISK